jgi:CHAT domain
MDNEAKAFRAFLYRSWGHQEILLALLPVISGKLAQRVVGLLRAHRPPGLRPLQERVASTNVLNEDSWQRLQGEISESLRSPFSKELWDLAERVPLTQRDKVISDLLDHLFDEPLRRGRGSKSDRGRKRKKDRDLGDEKATVSPINPSPADGRPPGGLAFEMAPDRRGIWGEERRKPEPKKPSPGQRQVQTGFAPVSAPAKPVDPKEPLSAGAHYVYWLAIGRPVAGAIETQPVHLPEDVPLGATIEVALFSFAGSLEIEPGADIGVFRLREDGVVEVERQPGRGEVEVPQKIRNRLLFPIKAPDRDGVARLRCNFYCKEVLILSLNVEAVVAGKGRTVLQPLDGEGRRLRSLPDYVLSRSLTPAHLNQLGEHRFSLMINGGEGTHDFRFFGTNGTDWVKTDVQVEAHALQTEIRLGREALRLAAWGDAGEWQPKFKYRYDRPRVGRELADDLARLAYAGYRLYLSISRRLTGADREAFERATLASGLVQVALKESPSLVLPAAILYDIPLDSNAFPIGTTEHRLCEVFEAALAGTAPLEECACFHGGCPHRRRVAEIRADPGRLVEEAGPVICPSGFWGFRHAIGLPVSVAGAPDAPGHIFFQGAPRIAVGVSTDPKLCLRGKHEIALQKLREGLGWEKGETRVEVLKMLRRTRAQIVYFYCHGGVTPSQIPYFEVGYGESGITPDNLTGNNIAWKEPRPLVFINGCHTTALTPELAINLVSAFVEEAAAAGVIGTEITVFEQLACDFAEVCLRGFLNGVQLGEAVRRARLELLHRGNPLGLAYIPFALASLNIVEQAAGIRS